MLCGMETTCQQCGTPFTAKNKGRRFCGRECFYASMRKRSGTRTCLECGEEFYFAWSGSEAHKGEFCSMQCAGKARRGVARPSMRGENHPNWKGGRHVRKRDGYVQIQIRDESGKRPWMLEHRYVLAQHLGRELRDYETVHHKNGDKADNRVENLELRVGRHGKGASEPHCPSCTCFAH